jgi:ketosteroid isomerase-like protein
LDKFVALMRRYCYDYTNRQDFAACDAIMVPGYTLHMGTHDLTGRDQFYKPATQKQFEQFPGLVLTINDIITNGQRLCLRFSEHGASNRHQQRRAAWGGIGLYKWDGERLLENFVEQDYYSRRLQLASGRPVDVELPAIAPWDTLPQAANDAAEALVREELSVGRLLRHPSLGIDDRGAAGPTQQILEPIEVQINDLFSAGDHVAFHIAQRGHLTADFSIERPELVGTDVTLHMAGVVTVREGAITAGRVIRDRLGLERRLAPPKT